MNIKKLEQLLVVGFSLLLVIGCSEEFNTSNQEVDDGPSKNVQPYTAQDVKLEQYSWQGDIPRANKIRVVNPYGGIITKNTNYRNVSVAGAIQLIGPKASAPRISARDENGVTILQVSYPDGNHDRFGRLTGRVDLGVYVPRGVTVDLQTDFGDIKSRKHKSNMILRTNSGKIKVGTSGRVQAFTDTGDIKLHIQKAKHQDPRFVESDKKRLSQVLSDSGKIELSVSPGLDIEFNALGQLGVTSNLMSNDKVNVQTKTDTHLLASLGKGTNTFAIEARNNAIDIKLLKSAGQISTASKPQSFDGNLKDLPKVKLWQPGDPIEEMQDGRADKQNNKQNNKQKSKKKADN